MATLSVEKSHCSQYHMISYDIISYHSEVLRSKYGSPVGLIDLMLKVPGSIMFHKKIPSSRTHGQMADESSWALTWGNLQEIFQECEQLGFCFRIHLDHLVKALGARAMTARSPQVLFLRTAWKSGASRAQPSGNVAPMATSLPHYSYSVCVCACFWGIDKSIHSVT